MAEWISYGPRRVPEVRPKLLDYMGGAAARTGLILCNAEVAFYPPGLVSEGTSRQRRSNPSFLSVSALRSRLLAAAKAAPGSRLGPYGPRRYEGR